MKRLPLSSTGSAVAHKCHIRVPTPLLKWSVLASDLETRDWGGVSLFPKNSSRKCPKWNLLCLCVLEGSGLCLT